MSSRKRLRESTGSDDEDVEIESASSSFRQSSNNKRSRIALAAERGGSVVSDEEDSFDFDMDSTQQEIDLLRSSVAPSINPSDVVTDIPSDEDEDEDDEQQEYREELRVGRILAKERKIRQREQNVVLDSGIIEEVFMRNFMCHSKLRVNLHPLINFIIGHNGSGKSAVLTALVMCLGGKAASTNRASSIKGTIKTGETSATLAVKIKNQGDNAYKPEIYGQSIIVERNFNTAGTSTFKLKNAEDKTVSTKRADLDDLLDHFSFQLDNPMSVLSQDNARQFLAGSSAETKYKFFIRGTQLEALDNDYQLIEENLDSTTEKLRYHEEEVAAKKAAFEAADRKKKHIESFRTFQEKINHYKWMHAWAQVENEEAALVDRQTRLSEEKTKVEDLEAAETLAQNEVEGHEQAANTAQRQLDSANEAVLPVDEEHTHARETFEENTVALKAKRDEERELRDDIVKTRKKITDAEDRVKAEEARIAANGDEAQQAREEELEIRHATAAEATRAHQDHKTRYGGLKETSDLAKRDLEIATTEYKAKNEAASEAEAKLKQFERSEGSAWDGYHANMANLVRAVKQETRFRGEVIGPLGQHVRLTDIRWQYQIESVLGNNSSAFAVTNVGDKNLLTSIMRRVQCNQTILIGSSEPLPRLNEPEPSILTIYRALTFDSEFAKRVLILNNYIEQVALAKNADEAKAFVKEVGKDGNVKNAIVRTTDGRGGVRYEVSNSGQLKSTPINALKGRPRMKTDREEQLAAYREQLQQARIERSTADNQQRGLRRTLEVAEQALRKWDKEEREKKITMQEAQAAVEDQKTEIESNRQGTGQLTELQSQVTQAQGQKSVQDQTFTDVYNALLELSTNGKELKKKLDEVQKKLDDARKSARDRQERFDKLHQDYREAVREKGLVTNRLQAAKDEVARREVKVKEQEKVVQEYLAGATEVCERVTVEPGVTWKQLDERIAKMEKEFEAMQREAGGTRTEIILAWQAAHDAHRTAVKDRLEQEKYKRTLTATLTIRRRRWKKFRRMISLRAMSMFQHLLSERNFRGRLLLNHTEKLLEIRVQPSATVDSDAGRQANTLSGGEKSYSLICLLLAIWEAMGTPIRCLDEFDVFMDSVNRSISMDMMIQAARGAQARQFILISPQAMSGVQMGNDVKIHKLNDPRLVERNGIPAVE